VAQTLQGEVALLANKSLISSENELKLSMQMLTQLSVEPAGMLRGGITILPAVVLQKHRG